MHTYKSIAVGTDGSATSMVAVRAAASLAELLLARDLKSEGRTA